MHILNIWGNFKNYFLVFITTSDREFARKLNLICVELLLYPCFFHQVVKVENTKLSTVLIIKLNGLRE